MEQDWTQLLEYSFQDLFFTWPQMSTLSITSSVAQCEKMNTSLSGDDLPSTITFLLRLCRFYQSRLPLSSLGLYTGAFSTKNSSQLIFIVMKNSFNLLTSFQQPAFLLPAFPSSQQLLLQRKRPKLLKISYFTQQLKQSF